MVAGAGRAAVAAARSRAGGASVALAAVLAAAAVLALGLGAGCYCPSIEDGQFLCGGPAHDLCPQGFVCNADRLCVRALGDGGARPDAGPDASPPVDAGPDASPPADAGPDAGPPADAGPDAGPPADAGPDAGETDGGTLPCAWSYRKRITIDAARVVGDQTDFPVLIHLASDADLAADAQDDGDDILFTASDGATRLSHETERFSGTTGSLTAWVKIPQLSSSVDTEIYLYYGNPTAGDQEDVADVWSNGFLGVWHLAETSGDHLDSTGNGFVGIPSGSVLQGVAGKIGGADEFVGPSTDTYLELRDGDLAADQPFTIEVWFEVDAAAPWAGMVTKGRELDHDWVGLWANGTQLTFGWDWDLGKGGNLDGSGAITTGVWHHAVATFDGSARRLYRDGSLNAGPSAGSYAGIVGSYASVANDRLDGVANSFDGLIDEVRISGVVRSAGWIATEHNNQDDPSLFHGAPGAEEMVSGLCP